MSHTVRTLAQALGLTVFTGKEMSRSVKGGYCGDLLSWVMGRAPAGGAWITIMSNVNVAAVAELADVACVILAEGVAPDAALLARAETENLALLGSGLTAYELAGRIFTALGV